MARIRRKKQTATARKQGFASLSPSRRREIASLGGRTAHERGTAHTFTSEEARLAGRKGGRVSSRNRRRTTR
jgi:uncharacterized protein